MDDVVKEAIESLQYAQEGWRENYNEASSDLKFLLGGEHQWDEHALSERKAALRLTLTNDRLMQNVNHVVNDIRQNTPTITPLPADGDASVETAEMLKDYIRHIEQVSNADVAYNTALEGAVKCSIGWAQVDHDYINDDTFEQEIRIREIVNPLSVLGDPDSTECDGSDMAYAFKLDTLTLDQFKKKYPKANADSLDASWMMNNAPSFSAGGRDDHVVVAEWFKKVLTPQTILLLEDGMIVPADQYKDLINAAPVKTERVIEKPKIKRYKVNGAEELEPNTDFPSQYIPLVPFYGLRHYVDGKRHLISLIRNAKDPQRMYNLMASLEAEWLQLSPRAPFMAALGAVEGLKEWAKPWTAWVLRYRTEDPTTKKPLPPPVRQPGPTIPAGLVNMRASGVEDIKAAMGIYDPSLGAESNEKSGKAIIARQNQGDLATFHFKDNGSRSIEQIGRIILDMLPQVIDTPRLLRTVAEDGTVQNVPVNGHIMPSNGQAPQGQQKPSPSSTANAIHDVRVGKYDVVVKTGPSYANKRLEMFDTFMQLGQTVPNAIAPALDLIVKNMDVPGADAIAARIKRSLPPQITADDDENGPPDLRPQMAQATQTIQKLDQAIQGMSRELEQCQQDLANKNAETQIKQAEAQSKQAESALKAREMAIKESQEQRAQAQFLIDRNLSLAELHTMLEDADTRRMAVEADLVKAHLDNQAEVAATQMQTEADKAIAQTNAIAAASKPKEEPAQAE